MKIIEYLFKGFGASFTLFEITIPIGIMIFNILLFTFSNKEVEMLTLILTNIIMTVIPWWTNPINWILFFIFGLIFTAYFSQN